MGGGGGQPKNTTTTTKTELPPWLANAYQGFFNQTNQVNNKPYESYPGQLNAAPTDQQQQAVINAFWGAKGNDAQTQALNGLVNGGQNISYQANPYAGSGNLNQLIAQTNQDVTNSYNKSAVPQLAAQFAQGGAFGGSAMAQAQQDSQQTLADRLAANTTGLRYQDLQNQQQLWQQGFQNQLAASQNNTQNILGASNALNGAGALQAQFNGQLAGLGQVYQDYNQGNIDQQYNDWYQQHFGYDQQRLANLGNALNSTAGQFSSSATSGLNPAYKPRTAGGAIASAGGGALAGAATGATIGAAGGPIGAGAGAVIGGGLALAGYYL